MNYAIYSKVLNGVQTVKNNLGDVIGVLVYSFDGTLKEYFESWEQFQVSRFGF